MCYYFSHDCDAHRSKKMRTLRGELGNRAYGVYWVLLEMLREDADHRLPLNFKALRTVVGESPKYIEDIVRGYKLFVIDEERGEFYSQGLMERMELVYNNKVKTPTEQTDPEEDAERKAELSRKRSQAGAKGGKIGGKAYCPSKANAKQKESKTDIEESKTKANAKQKESKTDVEESKTKANVKQKESKTDIEESKTKANVKQKESKTKANVKQKESKTDIEESKTKANAKQKESKSATHGGTMGGKIEKEKNEKVKEHTPQAPQGAGESLGAGGDELEGQAPKANSTTEEHSPKRRKEGGDPWGYDSETEEERAQYEATYRAYEAANEPPTPEEEERERAEREMKRYKTTPATLDEILAMYREHCPRLIPLVGYEQYKVREIVNALRDLTREGLEKMLQRAGRSSFLSGEVNGFRADFLWLMQRDNYRKVLAGNYDDRKPQPPTASATPAPAVGIPIETSDEKRKKLLERMERNVIRTTQPEEQ